ncbi:MAG: hypothetical protein ACRC4N_05570, partial [Gammaproteobacteria bacterium]
RALTSEAVKRPIVMLEELQKSTAQVEESVHRTTIGHVLHKSDLYGKMARRKLLLKERPRKSHLQFGTSHVGDTVKHVDEGALVR